MERMETETTEKRKLFDVISSGDFTQLQSFSLDNEQEMRTYLPFLTRIATRNELLSNTILSCIYRFPEVQEIKEYMEEVKWNEINAEIDESIRLQEKLSAISKGGIREYSYSTKLGEELSIYFEQSDSHSRMRIFISELLNVMLNPLENEKVECSDVLSNTTYLSQLSLIVPVALFNAPSLVLKEVIKGIIRTGAESSTSMILSIVKNSPNSYPEVIQTLLSLYPDYNFIENILSALSELSPRVAFYLRKSLVENKILHHLIFHITFHSLHDEVEFLSGLLFGEDHNWLRQWVKKNHQSPQIQTLRQRLSMKLHPFKNVNEDTVRRNVELNGILKLYCALMGLLGIQLTKSEAEDFLQVFQLNAHHSRTMRLALCFLLISEGLLKLVDKSAVINTIQIIMNGGTVKEEIVLIATHLHANQISALLSYIRGPLLNLPVSFHSESLSAIGELIKDEIIPEIQLAAASLQLPVIKKLSKESQRDEAIEVVYHMLKARVYHKHRSDPRAWILSQLKEAEEPIHPLLPSILEEFVSNSLLVYGLQPFTEKELKQTLSDEKTSITTQILVLYYILYFNEQSLKQKTDEKIRVFSREVLDVLPIKLLVMHVDSNRQKYAGIFGMMEWLVMNAFPQLFGVLNLLSEEEHEQSNLEELKETKSFVHSSICKLDESGIPDREFAKTSLSQATTSPLLASFVLDEMNSCDAKQLWNYLPALTQTLLPQLLGFGMSEGIKRKFVSIFEKLYLRYPWKSSLQFVQSLQLSMIKHTQSELIQNPLLLFRLDSRLFRQPLLLPLFLQRKVEEGQTVVLAQESAIVQQLLEICIMGSDDHEIGVIEQVRVTICGFLHDLFIENPLMIKLVHFQGYHPSLLSTTVNGIPSMHICLEFIPELLSQPQKEKQIFAVKLAAELIMKYPIARSLEIARMILAWMGTHCNISETVSLLPDASQQDPSYILETVPTLVQLCAAFPLITEEAVQLLTELMPINPNSVFNKNSVLVQTIQTTFQKLTKTVLS